MATKESQSCIHCSEKEAKKIRYFDALIDSSVVSKTDPEGIITHVNENFTKVTGFRPEEAIGKSHNILRHPDTPDRIHKHLWNTIKKGEVWRERVVNRNKDGTDFWADTIIVPLQDEKSAEILEYIAIRRDITDFLMMQRQLHKQRIQEEQQKKIAEAKDSFLLLFTHELKTPLNAIINFTKYLLKHVSQDTINNIPLTKRQKLLEQIESSANKMLGDVNNLLEISKLQTNKLYYNYSLIDVCDVLTEVINDHEALAKEHDTEVSLTCKCKKSFLTSDIYRLKQIIANVLSNAIKYSNKRVEITTHSLETRSIITIEDDGPGIKDKEKVFELFEQVGKDLKTRDQKGTGIGLYFLKLLCNDLKIKYSLEDSSKLGGLKFSLYIPIRREKDA